jgi:hypothetical protein
MKFVRMAVALVAIAGFAAGCGTGATSPPAHQPPAGATADLLRVPNVPTDQLTATNLDRSVVKLPGTADLSSPPSAAGGTVGSVGPWQLSLKSYNGQYLLISTPTAGCFSLWRLRLAESARWVLITPELSSPAHPSTCPAISTNKLWMVDLGSPLNDRTLLHPRVTAKLGPLRIGVVKG